MKLRSRRVRSIGAIVAARPMIPHGEGLGYERAPEDTLPEPKCVACKQPGFLDLHTDVWEHQDDTITADHEFRPHQILTGQRRGWKPQ